MVLPRGERAAGVGVGEDAGTVGVRVPDLPSRGRCWRERARWRSRAPTGRASRPRTTAEGLLAAFGDEVAVYLTIAGDAGAGSGEPRR